MILFLQMIRRLLPVLVLLLLFMPHFAQAQEEVLVLSKGKNFTLQGSGFGEFGEFSNICFNNTSTCYNTGNPAISSWTNTSIVFMVPSNIPTFGSLLLFPSSASLAQKTFQYTLSPSISSVSSVGGTTGLAFSIPKAVITIHGSAFGTNRGAVNVGLEGKFSYGPSGTVLKWNDAAIEVELPSVLQSTAVLIVTRPDGKTALFEPFSVEKSISNDPFVQSQAYFRSSTLFDMWETFKKRPQQDVVVAVIDSSVYINHPDLQGSAWENPNEVKGDGLDNDGNGYKDDRYGWNFIANSNDVSEPDAHGTAVAGIIAAQTDNGIGIAGIAKSAKIMPLVACGPNVGCPTSAIVQAIYYAVNNGARIINMSLAGTRIVDYTSAYDEAIQYAVSSGVAVVVSVGNGDLLSNGLDTSLHTLSPVCNEKEAWQVIGVGAADSTGSAKTTWTNYGKCADLFAPGQNVYTLTVSGTDRNLLYEKVNGTSFAAPIVSGVLAQIFSVYPDMSAKKAYDFLKIGLNNGVLNAGKTAVAVSTTYNASLDTGVPWKIPAKSEVETKVPGTTADFIGGGILETPSLFSDVRNTHKHREAIDFLAEQGIVAGYDDGSFRPNIRINRAEFTKIVMGSVYTGKLAKGNCFPDVKEEWFAPFVCTAKNLGIVGGNPDGTFRPGDNIDTAAAYKIVLEAFVEADLIKDLAGGAWYAKYLAYAAEKGIAHDTKVDPVQLMTRGGMAQLVYNVMQR